MPAIASDFGILLVGLGSIIIAILLVILGVTAYSSNNRNKKTVLMAGVFFLTLLGILLVIDEASHMNDLDFYGLLGTILIPGLLAFLLPLYSLRRRENKTK